MKFRLKDSMDFFSTLEEVEAYIKETENLSIADLEILTDAEYEALFEGEIIPDESSAMTPIEWLRSQKDKGAEPIIERHPSNELPAYQETLNTNNYLREYILRSAESIQQPSSPSCGYCGESWCKIESNLAPEHREQLAVYAGKPIKFKDSLPQEIQTGGLRNQNKQYADAKIPLKVHHLKTKHQAIYRFLVDAGVVMQFETVTDDYGNSSLKPTNKRNTEHLSDTELATRIQENPELREKFFKRWIESLQK